MSHSWLYCSVKAPSVDPGTQRCPTDCARREGRTGPATRRVLFLLGLFVPPLTSVECSTVMPWTCPACSLAIRHTEQDDRPRPNVVYRCHICRLELILDPSSNKLVLAPMRER